MTTKMTDNILDKLTNDNTYTDIGHITGTLAIYIKGLCKTIELLEKRVTYLEDLSGKKETACLTHDVAELNSELQKLRYEKTKMLHQR